MFVGGNMMHGGGYEDDEARPQDVGKFIPQSDLVGWWTEMQRKYPQVFLPSDPCPDQQHAAGTKLMSYFDDDPNKPIRIQVVGSKFRNEFGTGRYAFYVVKYPNGELAFVHLTAAHEEDGWKVGWDVPPPQTVEEAAVEKKSSNGGITWLVVLIAFVGVGAAYYYQTQQNVTE